MISGTILSFSKECRKSWPVADGERSKFTSPQFFENCPKKSRGRKSVIFFRKWSKEFLHHKQKFKIFDAAKVGHLVCFSRIAAEDQLFPKTGSEPECD